MGGAEVRNMLKVATREKLSYEEFLIQYDGIRAEWVNGDVVALSTETWRHQDIVSFLLCILGIYVEQHCSGRVIPFFQMKLSSDLPGREPDLLFVASANLDRVKYIHLDGPADIAVEIISPDSINRDRGEKFVEYESAGVLEYWLIDPIRKQADFYRIGADDHYHPVLPDDEGVYRSKAVKGFWLRVSWLWQKPMPPILQVWKEMNLL